MSIQKKNIFHTLNFNSFFPQLTQEVRSAVESFWEIETPVALQAVNNFKDVRSECLITDMDFFSSQIRVEHHKPVLIRFSKDFIEGFLSTVLQNTPEGFLLSSLTPLEVKILNSFSEFLYKKIKEILISPKDAKLTEESEKKINFLFVLNPAHNAPPGHLVISIPKDRIPFKPLSRTVSFKDEDFLTSAATVKIRIGRTKITLEDLENLSSEDIILLEESNLSYLTLVSGKLEQNFKVKIDPSLIVNLQDEDEIEETGTNNEFNNEVTMEKNLWDDIQIELSAEFEKVKMTIGELKQITQGQVVDLGSVFDNEISLYVENKKVASGELIIINDRYAVKLSEVLSSSVKQNTMEPKNAAKEAPKAAPAQKPAQNAQKPAAKPAPAPQNPQQPAVEDEEFDYSDFEK